MLNSTNCHSFWGHASCVKHTVVVYRSPGSGKVGLRRIINRLWAIPTLVLRVLHVDECPAGRVMVTVRGRRGKWLGVLAGLYKIPSRVTVPCSKTTCVIFFRGSAGRICGNGRNQKGILPNFFRKSLTAIRKFHGRCDGDAIVHDAFLTVAQDR